MKMKIAVLSDLHYYDETLGTSGVHFENYLIKDRKLLKESSKINEGLIEELINSDVEVVLISGDLTKDGEKRSHLKLVNLLKKLKDANKLIYVIPGNHDINNPNSCMYSENEVTKVENISKDEFKDIYYNYGFKDAISKDINSLSYVVEPIDGLRIIAMDSSRYDEYIEKNKHIVGGKFKEKTFKWIKEQIKDAKDKGIKIIGFTHHNILEHFKGQKMIFDEFVIDEYNKISSELADEGLKIVFSGHFHAMNIAEHTTSNNNKIYDIETASPISYPCSYRIIEIDRNIARIKKKLIDNIVINTNNLNFKDFILNDFKIGMKYLMKGFLAIFLMKLTSIEKEEALKKVEELIIKEIVKDVTIEDLLTEIFVSHYGDEPLNIEYNLIIESLLKSNDFILMSIANSISTAYNNIYNEEIEILI